MNSKQYFDNVSEKWDEMQKSFFSENVRNKAFSVAEIECGKMAADCGCGTGFITEGLLAHKLNVIAIDQSEKMISVLKQKFKNYNNIEYKIGSSDHLPIEDNTVDYVFANMYLHHVADPMGAIKEMSRIMKTDGKLVITDLDKHDFVFLNEEHCDRWMGFDRADIRNWFSQANLSRIDVNCVGTTCNADSICSGTSASVNIFYAFGVKI